MRCVLACVGAILCILPARAGLFLPEESIDFVSKDGKTVALTFDQFRLKLGDVVGIAARLATPTRPREQYLARARELEDRRRRLTTDELNVLGAYYYRLNEFDKAFAVLIDATQKDRRNFVAYSHLTLNFFAQGDLVQARRYSDAAPRPKSLPGFSSAHSAWLLRADEFCHKLLISRGKEQRQKIPLADIPLDDLFGVQFVGENGEYEAGRIASSQREKLPDDAIAIVQQLLLWMPGDSRLLWLLAELYNATGETGNAATLMNECMDARRFATSQLKDHRRVIQDRLDQIRDAEEQKDFRKHPEIMWAVGISGGALIVMLVVWQLRLFVRRLGK